MGKGILIIIIILIALGVGFFVYQQGRSDSTVNTNNDNTFTTAEIVTGAADLQIKAQADHDLAIAQAQQLWRQALVDGTDLSSGPCLSNDAIPDWVIDVAHNPRQDVDDEPANQCSAYRAGTAHHFVEIDPEGVLIRAE